MTQRPLPVPTPWSAPFWEAARDGRLIYQFCTESERPVVYPKRISPYTLSDTLEWRESAGGGEIYTYTVQHLGAPSGFDDKQPYVIAIVRMDEGFQMMANVLTEHPEQVRCGDRVRATFVEAADDVKLLAFVPEPR